MKAIRIEKPEGSEGIETNRQPYSGASGSRALPGVNPVRDTRRPNAPEARVRADTNAPRGRGRHGPTTRRWAWSTLAGASQWSTGQVCNACVTRGLPARCDCRGCDERFWFSAVVAYE
jgi:hypothetical protein